MSRIIVCVALALAAAGCGGAQNEEPIEAAPGFDGTITLLDGTKQPINDFKPLAGDYDFITETRDVAAEEMGFDSVLNRRKNIQGCIDEEQVKKGFEFLVVKDHDPETCRYEFFTIEDGQLSSVMRCVAEGVDLTFETTGEVGPRKSEWLTKVTGKALGMTENVAEKVTLNRIKDCKANQ